MQAYMQFTQDQNDQYQYALSTGGLYLSYSSRAAGWAYLYDSPAVITVWPVGVTEASARSGQRIRPAGQSADDNTVYTGQDLQIAVTMAFFNFLNVTDDDGSYWGCWDTALTQPGIWQLFMDPNLTPNEPVPIGCTSLILASTFNSSAGYLVAGDDPPYVAWQACAPGSALQFAVEAYPSNVIAKAPALREQDDRPRPNRKR